MLGRTSSFLAVAHPCRQAGVASQLRAGLPRRVTTSSRRQPRLRPRLGRFHHQVGPGRYHPCLPSQRTGIGLNSPSATISTNRRFRTFPLAVSGNLSTSRKNSGMSYFDKP